MAMASRRRISREEPRPTQNMTPPVAAVMSAESPSARPAEEAGSWSMMA